MARLRVKEPMMKNFALVVIAVVAAGLVATYVRYRSLDPCDWMEQDLARQSKLPLIVLQGRIRAYFLIRGVVAPDPYDCVLAWWKLRAKGVIVTKPQNGPSY